MRPTGHALDASADARVRIPGLTALAVAIALSVDLLTYKLVGYDLAAYILGARRLLAGQPLYQTDLIVLGPFGQFLYPPPAALLFVPLALLPFDTARLLVLLGLASLAALVIWYLVHELRPATRYWAAAASALFFPLVWEIGLGNLTLVTLALCLLTWHLRRRETSSGVALAVALVLKLLPLALIPYFLVVRRTRLVAWSALALAVALLVSWPVLSREWIDFGRVLVVIMNAPPGSGSNVVPLLFSAAPLRSVLPALGIAVVLVAALAARRSAAAEEHAFRVALAAAPLLASTLWYPYLVFAMPLLLADAPSPRPRLRIPYRLARPATWYLMQWQVIREPGRDFLLPLVGLLLLIAVGLAELRFALAERPDQATQYQSANRIMSTAEPTAARTT